MSSNYAYTTREIKFCLKEWLPLNEILSYDMYKDMYSIDDIDMMVDQVHKIAKEVIGPTAEDAEKYPAHFENGKVTVAPSFKQLYKYLQENGWGTSNIDENGGGMCFTMMQALGEMMNAANPSFMPYVALTTGAAGLIQKFADEKLKKMFLPKMMDGTWSGTMCLTEPTAGSDVGDILSRAYPTDDPRIYKIKGSKIFITGGDHDMCENIIHMYLARIEGAKPGTKGISLFIVPKYWVNENGEIEGPNDVETTGVEHKMGLKGSATAALTVGENNNCRGWLLGHYNPETGEGDGMKQMFVMMNEERLNTGQAALSVAWNAYRNAAQYCKDRIQGRPLTAMMKGDRVPIIQHEDVKRMLLYQKSVLEACRAIVLRTGYYIDVAHHDPDPERRQWAKGRWDSLTPIAKAYPSDEAWICIGEAIQSYGGYGYCEDYPVAQAARDCKIYSIWEGTNYIQALDLVGRKWTAKGGQVFAGLLQDIDDFINSKKEEAAALGLDKEMANLEKALGAYRAIQMAVLGFFQSGQIGLVPTYARRILTASGQLIGGWLLMEQALIAKKKMNELGSDHYDYNFYLGKVMSCQYYLRNVVPNVWFTQELVEAADPTCMEAPPEIFEY